MTNVTQTSHCCFMIRLMTQESKLYRSIFISDFHLGTKDSQAKSLLEFLKNNESENLFLVGDIIDGWSLRRKMYWPQEHSDVVQKILRKARKNTNVFYIIGNHDEFLRKFIPISLGERLLLMNEYQYTDLKGRKIEVVHGDAFDSITMNKKWLALLGDVIYQFLLRINRPLNSVRRFIGYRRYWSLSKYLKQKVKKSVQFIDNYEKVLSDYAKNKKLDGILCGHIHHAEIRQMGSVLYLNSGDWVESCTALVETLDGEWQLIDAGDMY